MDNPLIKRRLQIEEAKALIGSDGGEGSALAGIVRDALSANTRLQESSVGQQREELKAQAAELRDVRDRLNAPGANPIEIYAQMREVVTGAAADMLKQMGYLGQGQSQLSDPKVIAEIENMKGQREEAQRQWQTQHDAQQHQWDVENKARERLEKKEDRRWEAEFGLKKEQQDRDNRGRDNTAAILQDAVRSISGGIDIDRTAVAKPLTTVTEALLPKPITSFKCEQCGEIIQVTNPEAREATCPKCSTLYRFEEVNASDAEATPNQS